jgi:hypothetical protein
MARPEAVQGNRPFFDFEALLLACYHFCGYVRFVHGFVGHVGAHLDIDVDEAAVCHRYTGFISGNFLPLGVRPLEPYPASATGLPI